MTKRPAAPLRLTWPQVVARRLARHGLAVPAPAARMAEQAAEMGGVHAQIISAAELSLGLRVEGVTRAGVREALWTDHTLIKTFGPRGTVHLLAAQDLPLWTGALSAIPQQRNPAAKDAFLTQAQTDEVVDAIGAALAEAELTLDELNAALGASLGPWAIEKVMPAFQDLWPRWRQAMDTAANRGALVFGPNRGRNVTYTNPRRWLPGFQPAEGQAALAGLVRRYLHAYGPATPQQFARWLSGPPRWAEELFQSLAAGLEPVALDGELAWQVAGDTEAPAAPPEGLRLLPYFDAYVVGSHPRAKVFPGPAAERALARGQAGNYPVLLIDGVVGGVWHQRRAGNRLALTVEPFTKMSARQRQALDEQVERTGAIQEAKATLTLGPVTIGPHA